MTILFHYVGRGSTDCEVVSSLVIEGLQFAQKKISIGLGAH